MKDMKEFVIALISVALLNGAFGMLAPEGDLRKYVKLLGSLCLVCAVASPIFTAIKAEGGGFEGLFPDIPENESRYEDVYGEALAKGKIPPRSFLSTLFQLFIACLTDNSSAVIDGNHIDVNVSLIAFATMIQVIDKKSETNKFKKDNK